MPMKRIEKFIKSITLSILVFSLAVVVGAFYIHNSKLKMGKESGSDNSLIHTTYSVDDFESETTINTGDNYLKELGLASANPQNNFKLLIDEEAGSSASFSYYIDNNSDGFYEEGERNNSLGSLISIDKNFNTGTDTTINFRIIPGKGRDANGLSANTFYISSVSFYLSSNTVFAGSPDYTLAENNCESKYGELIYPNDPIYIGDIVFSLSCDDSESGEVECRLTTRNNVKFPSNLKIGFKLSHKDNLSFANNISLTDNDNVTTLAITNGDYTHLNNIENTFSVDDRLNLRIDPGSKIVKTIKIGKRAASGEFTEWFTLYGGVSAGVRDNAFSKDANELSNIVTYSNFSIGFTYTNDYIVTEGEKKYGLFDKLRTLYDSLSGDIIGVQVSVDADNVLDHRHKFVVSLYENGEIEIEKVGNECSLGVEVTTQHYFIVNLQESQEDETSVASVMPYASIKVSANSENIVDVSGEALTKTTYIGVGDSSYTIDLYVELNENYGWYVNDTMRPSKIVEAGRAYSESFEGGVRTMTAVAANMKSVNVYISVYIVERENARLLENASDLEIWIGNSSANESPCFFVSNYGVGTKNFKIAETEAFATCSYSVVIPSGLEIYKYSIDGEETNLTTTLLGVSNVQHRLEEDSFIEYYVRVIQMEDISVIDEEGVEIGKLAFSPSIDTSLDYFALKMSLRYKNMTASRPSYSLLYSGNRPRKEGYDFVGMYERNATNGKEDNFIIANGGSFSYVGVGISPWTYYTELYEKYREARLVLKPIFTPIIYTLTVLSKPDATEQNPNPASVTTVGKIAYDSTRLYLENKPIEKIGHHIVGISCTDGTIGDIKFVDDSTIGYDETKELYYYDLANAWQFTKNNLRFNVILESNEYNRVLSVVEATRFYTNNIEEKTESSTSVVKYNSQFTMQSVIDSYKLTVNNLSNSIKGYNIIGYLPFALYNEEIEDGAIEVEDLSVFKYFIVDNIEEEYPEYADYLIGTDEEIEWKYLREVKFVPVFKLGTFILTLHADSGNSFSTEIGDTTRTISVKFNEEFTNEFISMNFPATMNRIGGYDFAGYYMLDKSGNKIQVVGANKTVSTDPASVSYICKDITNDVAGKWIQDFSYVYDGKIYWAVSENLDLYVQYDLINFDFSISASDGNDEAVSVDDKLLDIYAKGGNGDYFIETEGVKYSEFIETNKKLTIDNIVTIKSVGDDGRFVRKITIKYNSIFNSSTFKTAYVFEFDTDKLGNMKETSDNTMLADYIYFDVDSENFVVNIKKVIESEFTLFGTIATIDDIVIELEYGYRTYVVGFQTGAYSMANLELVTPPTDGVAEIAYYLVSYDTRNDFTTWQPCDIDGVLLEDVSSWQDIMFNHNGDEVVFCIESLERAQEVDIVIGAESYFFTYWARKNVDGEIEPLSWDWTDGSANMANSEDGGELIYYSAFSKTADINIYYYTWDPVAKENTGEGYVKTSQKGYFWHRDDEDGSFRTVNTYERYKIGNNTYYITGWIWLEDNVDNASSSVVNTTYYSKKNNMFVDSYTAGIIGSVNVASDYMALLEDCTVKYRGNTSTDETKIKIHCYAVYSLYEYEPIEIEDKTEYEIKMRVPNDYDGNSYTTDNLYWGAIASTEYSRLLGTYLTLKDIINSGEIVVHTLESFNGRKKLTKTEIEASLSGSEYDLLICYYSRDVLSLAQPIIVDGICIGTQTASGFQFNVYDRVGSYANGTLVGALDEYVELSGTYMTAYTNVINQLQASGITEVEYMKRELIARITLQLLQWDNGFNTDNTTMKTKGIVFEGRGPVTVGFEGSGVDINLLECIRQISLTDGGKISVTSEGFVRLVYALAGYSIMSTDPASAVGLFGAVALNEGTQLITGSELTSGIKSGDIIVGESGSTTIYSIWLYSFLDNTGASYSVLAHCRGITASTELIGGARNCYVVESNGALIYDSGTYKFLYKKLIKHI